MTQSWPDRNEDEYWAEVGRECDARDAVIRSMEGRIIDLNEVERRVQRILAGLEEMPNV